MLKIFYNRRSTRKFSDQKIEDEKIKKLLTAALLAPSSKGSRPWEFIVVDDPALLAVLAISKPHGASLLKHAPLAIIIAGDKTKSDVWVEDCSIASVFVQLEAEALGLGSCWVQVRCRQNADGDDSEDVVKRLLGIPSNLRVESIIAIGMKEVSKEPHDLDNLSWEKVHIGTYTPTN